MKGLVLGIMVSTLISLNLSASNKVIGTYKCKTDITYGSNQPMYITRLYAIEANNKYMSKQKMYEQEIIERGRWSEEADNSIKLVNGKTYRSSYFPFEGCTKIK